MKFGITFEAAVRGLQKASRIISGQPAPAPAQETEQVPKDELWAVWHYDSFPFLICAKVMTLDERGCVEAEGYDKGYWFKASHFLPGKRGRDFKNYLAAARTVYREMETCLHNALCDELIKDCKEWEVRPPTGNTSGFRGYGMGESYRKGINQIRAGNAPAFPYGHDSKPKVKE